MEGASDHGQGVPSHVHSTRVPELAIPGLFLSAGSRHPDRPADLELFSTSGIVSAAKQAVATGQEDDIERERAREELIGRCIENEAKSLIQNLLATGFSALAAALVTIAGAILAVRGYLDTREKERQDRLDTRQKERADQLATMLNETVTRLVSNEARQRVVGAAGLVPFFTPDRGDFLWRP
jgi:hypothetical protein